MEEILHQLIGSLSHYLQVLSIPGVKPDFFHQQYVYGIKHGIPDGCWTPFSTRELPAGSNMGSMQVGKIYPPQKLTAKTKAENQKEG